MIATLLGTGLTAAGASVLNQVIERKFDALMRRTANRPLPAGRVCPGEAWFFGVVLSAGGTAVLAALVNPLTASLGAITIATYLLVYTPAKRRTTLCTLVGAVPGAIPAVMGFTAMDGAITAPALAMFGILFVWQMPHFLSIAILYRDNYASGGFRMLPVEDEGLEVSTRQIVLYSLALVPTTLLPVALGMAGLTYFAAAILLGAAFCGFGIICAGSKSLANARRLFLASIVYLPGLLASMMFDRI
jgi:protoheme IX farnesyltransferase